MAKLIKTRDGRMFLVRKTRDARSKTAETKPRILAWAREILADRGYHNFLARMERVEREIQAKKSKVVSRMTTYLYNEIPLQMNITITGYDKKKKGNPKDFLYDVTMEYK